MNQSVKNRVDEALRELSRIESRQPGLAFDKLHRLLREIDLANDRPQVETTKPDTSVQCEDGFVSWAKCLLGRHTWRYDRDLVKGESSGKQIALSWAVCSGCSESKLLFILR